MNTLPITLLQNMMLAFCSSAPHLPIANAGGVIKFDHIDADKLVEAQQAVMACHASFDFYFQQTPNGIEQHQHARCEHSYPITDLSALPFEHAEQVARDKIETLFTTPISAFEYPLHRNEIFILPNNQVWLAFLANHLICDGYSAFAYLKQVVDYYDKGHTPTNTQFEPVQLASQQAEYLTSNQYQKDKTFWLNHLAAPIEFRLFSPTNPLKSKAIHLSLPRSQLTPIVEFANQHELSLSTLMLTLWIRQLNQDFPLPNSNQLRVGLPVHGRKKSESNLIAFMANMLVHEFSLSDELDLAAQAQQISTQLKHTYRHKKLPPELLYEDLNLPPHIPLSEFRFGYMELEKLSDTPGMPRSFSYESHQHHSLPLQLNVINFHGVDQVDFLIEYNPNNLNEEQVVKHIKSLFDAIKNIASN
ncbi:condensation domain-containing protein [Pseudoalteromonas umbrosa]|uniref:condensation domain-containing protein n=1 Tax=Pseudoalteromonas umbrosa TaxID=3048489 RepID=UPI0024C3DD86|nr:condensation domain-containing protein [Pseudoalteromonas sp. B95]MDK1286873.1 condensation domain-containing protein [Pseudoalteromonas sp. B95]